MELPLPLAQRQIKPHVTAERTTPTADDVWAIAMNPRDNFLFRHFNRLAVFATAASAFWLGAIPSPAQPAPETQTAPAIVLGREGKVETATRGSSTWSAVSTNQALNAGDRLRTGLRSRATLRWSDLSVVRVNELTTMEIQPPAKAGNKAELDLKSGAAYFFSREKPSEIQFRTPVASGAIRGTEFNLHVAEDGSLELALLDGEVDVANAQGSVTLKSGEQANVEPGKAPRKTAVLDAASIIQWALYYPAVVEVSELGLSESEQRELANSLAAYRGGDLLQALDAYPAGRTATSEAERTYRAALALAVGQTDDILKGLENAKSGPANALREMVQVVKGQHPATLANPTSASEWMARSYTLQSRSELEAALAAAQTAASKAPQFGFAAARVAELEFSFGRRDAAAAALNQALASSPRNAQAIALNGFLLAARGCNPCALTQFDKAIAIDPALGNAWLGRGLIKFRTGNSVAGREDLQVAATVEPNRSLLRSYLGKGFAQRWDAKHAMKELALAQKLDPNDPTPWLYSALLNEQQNRINDAIADLEKSKALNDNRSVFRSRMLLDQDQAVRGANLAAIYRDAGMRDYSVTEASRAVNADYANHSAHLFLANSYDALRDPKQINLRYETPWFSELMVANLLAPVAGGNLSQNVSQQEYSRLFEGDHHGVFSFTEYTSAGDWLESGSLYGVMGRTGYSFDAFYRNQNGDRPNNDLEQMDLSLRLKQELTEHDSLFFQVSYANSDAGDLAQYYYQTNGSRTLRTSEEQAPNVIAGYHRQWSPGHDTLLMVGRFDDDFALQDTAPALPYLRTAVSLFTGATNISLRNAPFTQVDYTSHLVAYSAELAHIWKTARQTLVAGARYQTGSPDTDSNLNRQSPLDPAPVNVLAQSESPSLERASVYAYENFQLLDELLLTAGFSYDHLRYPLNVDVPPITSGEDTADQFSPKAGVIWSPLENTHFRGAYSKSLGGVYFDNSVRLEPTQIAGFNQAFRSLIPESVAGLVPGTEFETFGLGWDQSFKTGTYFTIQGEILNSDGARTIGLLTNSDTFVPQPDSPSAAHETLEFEERSLLVALSQTLGADWSVGVRYKLTDADLVTRFTGPSTLLGNLDQDVSATLHQVLLHANYYHRCGFFAEAQALWTGQSNSGYSPALADESFWQFNLYAGYRFKLRHAEARLGLVNLTDQDYRLNPLTLYRELPRERMFTASFKFYF